MGVKSSPFVLVVSLVTCKRFTLATRSRYKRMYDDDDNGFGATVRCAPVVTKVRYRKKNLVKKNKNQPNKQTSKNTK